MAITATDMLHSDCYCSATRLCWIEISACPMNSESALHFSMAQSGTAPRLPSSSVYAPSGDPPNVLQETLDPARHMLCWSCCSDLDMQ